MYSDGVTEAEDGGGRRFDQAGLQHVVDGRGWGSAKELGWAVLVARRLPPLPVVAVAEGAVVGV